MNHAGKQKKKLNSESRPHCPVLGFILYVVRDIKKRFSSMFGRYPAWNIKKTQKIEMYEDALYTSMI